MTVSKVLKPFLTKPTPWAFVLTCLLVALAPLLACGPEPERETPAAQAGGAQAAPGATESEAGPASPAGEAAETPPEPAPLGAEPEAPPPSPSAEAPEAPPARPTPEPPPESAPTPPATPEELEPDIEEAEPAPPPPAPLPTAEDLAAGKEVFLAQRCNTCHTVSTAGIEAKLKSTSAPDLAGVAERRDRSSIEAILHQEQPVDGKKHPKRFSGSQEELNALIDWLLSQG